MFARSVGALALLGTLSRCTSAPSPSDATAPTDAADLAALDVPSDAASAVDARDATDTTSALDVTASDENVALDATDATLAVDASAGWEITVYYTAVESFHSGAPQTVQGCLTSACSMGSDNLGTYPSDFVQAVYDEGTGRITSGTYAGQYLNWSIDVGYWLDTAPRDARGDALQPWVSAAADPNVPYGATFRVTDCGVDDTTLTPIDPTVCARFEAATWVVGDRFTVGSVGAHVDLYIGEEDQADFVNTSPDVISNSGATLAFAP